MLTILEKIAQVFLTQQEHTLQLRELKVEFVRNQKNILHHLQLCKKSGGILGVYCGRLGKGMFLATVAGINDSFVTLRAVDDSERLQRESLTVQVKEITAICPFNQIYADSNEDIAETFSTPLNVMHIN